MEWKIIQAVIALAAYTGILWWFFFGPRAKATAMLSASGAQELTVTVQGGYSPDRLVARKGIPLRIKFTRKETSSCSERVVFGDLDISKALPENETTVVEFTPDRAGEFTFTCGMGMYQGKLVVQDGEVPAPGSHQHTGHSHTGHNHAGHNDTGHSHTGHNHAGHNDTGHSHTGHNHTGHSNTGHSNTGHSHNEGKNQGVSSGHSHEAHHNHDGGKSASGKETGKESRKDSGKEEGAGH